MLSDFCETVAAMAHRHHGFGWQLPVDVRCCGGAGDSCDPMEFAEVDSWLPGNGTPVANVGVVQCLLLWW